MEVKLGSASPRRNTLLSFSPNIPEHVAGEIVVGNVQWDDRAT